MHAHPLLPEPKMAQDTLDDILLVDMSETMRISREHFGHRSGSASHTFLINSRHYWFSCIPCDFSNSHRRRRGFS
jgi:hypothetical protein